MVHRNYHQDTQAMMVKKEMEMLMGKWMEE
jgi:hypothetical protein